MSIKAVFLRLYTVGTPLRKAESDIHLRMFMSGVCACVKVSSDRHEALALRGALSDDDIEE